MGSFSYQLQGLNDVIKNIDAFGRDIKAGIASELASTAEDIISDAKMAAPVDLGNLRANIRLGESTDLTKVIVSGAEYSAYVEFGTGSEVEMPEGPGMDNIADYAIQFKGAGIRKVNLPARPFLFPAVIENTQKMIERLKKLIS